MKVLAAWLLMKVGKPADKCVVENINPLNDDYFLQKETKMLDELRNSFHLEQIKWEDLKKNGITSIRKKFQSGTKSRAEIINGFKG